MAARRFSTVTGKYICKRYVKRCNQRNKYKKAEITADNINARKRNIIEKIASGRKESISPAENILIIDVIQMATVDKRKNFPKLGRDAPLNAKLYTVNMYPATPTIDSSPEATLIHSICRLS
jgi:hypothetical protein